MISFFFFLLSSICCDLVREGVGGFFFLLQFLNINWKDLNWEKSYSGWKAYGQSKTANILFANEVTKRYAAQGLTANCMYSCARM